MNIGIKDTIKLGSESQRATTQRIVARRICDLADGELIITLLNIGRSFRPREDHRGMFLQRDERGSSIDIMLEEEDFEDDPLTDARDG